MKALNEELMKFVDNTPNAFSCVENIKNILEGYGYTELDETCNWKDPLNELGNKFYVTRNDSSIIAFNTGGKGYNIVSTHTDQPSFVIKPNPEIIKNGYVKLNISGYGAMISESWLDRPLSIAGRVILKNDDTFSSEIINIDKNLLIIPRQARHINRDAENGVKLNPQIDMQPILGLEAITGCNYAKIENIISDELENKGISYDFICDYDLSLYNRDKTTIIGAREEMISGPRLDDLACVYPSLMSFVSAGDNSKATKVFCALNNEEIGSLSMQGADSTFLLDTLTRISEAKGFELLPDLSSSFIVSADNGHAIHPNAANKSDPTNIVRLNEGVVIKHHINYTTDALTSSIFKDMCTRALVPYQDFACKSDMLCGATLGKISQSHVPINSVDVGIPQLAMHSAYELMGTKDTVNLYNALVEFYESSFEKNGKNIKVYSKTDWK